MHAAVTYNCILTASRIQKISDFGFLITYSRLCLQNTSAYSKYLLFYTSIIKMTTSRETFLKISFTILEHFYHIKTVALIDYTYLFTISMFLLLKSHRSLLIKISLRNDVQVYAKYLNTYVRVQR